MFPLFLYRAKRKRLQTTPNRKHTIYNLVKQLLYSWDFFPTLWSRGYLVWWKIFVTTDMTFHLIIKGRYNQEFPWKERAGFLHYQEDSSPPSAPFLMCNPFCSPSALPPPIVSTHCQACQSHLAILLLLLALIPRGLGNTWMPRLFPSSRE